MKRKRGVTAFLLVFLADLIWTLFIGAVFSVWVYRVNDGEFRWFIAAAAAAGFAVWHATFGRVVTVLAEKAAVLLRRVFAFLVLRPLRRIGRAAGKAARKLWRMTGGRVQGAMKRRRAIRTTERLRRTLRQDLSFGERREIS